MDVKNKISVLFTGNPEGAQSGTFEPDADGNVDLIKIFFVLFNVRAQGFLHFNIQLSSESGLNNEKNDYDVDINTLNIPARNVMNDGYISEISFNADLTNKIASDSNEFYTAKLTLTGDEGEVLDSKETYFVMKPKKQEVAK